MKRLIEALLSNWIKYPEILDVGRDTSIGTNAEEIQHVALWRRGTVRLVWRFNQ
jgi:hypothetical protein